MKTPPFSSIKAFGVITMLSLIAACVVAQMPAGPTPDPAWYWTTIYGQSVQVCGVTAPDGKLRWTRDWRGDERIAPSELERREKAAAIDQRPPPPTPSPQAPAVKPAINYGVNVEQLTGDGRTIRASDPATLAKVKAVVESARRKTPEYCEVHGTDKCPNGGGCKPKPAEPERKPGIVERAEDEVKKLLLYAIAAIVVLAAVFVVLQSKPRT
jgi:hypothetical protein